MPAGTGPFTYVWYKDGTVLAGETGSSFTTNNVSAVSAGTYSVVVSGACGSVTNSATLTVLTQRGSATALTSLTNCPGTSASFSTVATGTGPYSYQWKKDGAVLAGETGSSLTTNNVSAAGAGTYSVVVSGTCGKCDQQRDPDGATPTSSATASDEPDQLPGHQRQLQHGGCGHGPYAISGIRRRSADRRAGQQPRRPTTSARRQRRNLQRGGERRLRQRDQQRDADGEHRT